MTSMAVVPQKMRRERSMFSSSDDTAMMKQIQATHAPDGREFSVKPLLHIVEDIFLRATPALGMTSIVQQQGAHQAQLDELEEKALQNGFHETIEMLSYNINKISCEMSCKCSGGGDAHATTLAIFNLVSNYSWDEKVVLALAGFAVNYGEFWLVAQLYLTNPLAKAVALLKQLPDIIERADNLKTELEALTTVIKAMMDLGKCIVQFKELPSQYITPDTPEMLTATAHIPTAVYWTIRSIVACTSQIVGLTSMGHEYIASTTEAWELSGLAHKVSNIHSHLMKQLTLCFLHIDEKKHHEAYLTLVRLLESVHIDNMKILKALIYAKDDQLPLFDGSTKKRASLDLLRRKSVLLLISDLEPSHEEFSMLQQMYSEAREQPGRTESQYEIVWLPVMDRSTPWNETKKKQFEDFQSSMPWYSVYDPSLLEVAVIRYIKEVWHFNKKPLLVVLDPQGKVVNPNAIHMMWIWGSLAFPFTSLREEGLWKEETWKIDLLADNIDPALSSWIEQGKFICLYGGEDIKWIRKFTATAKAVAKDAGIQLEMLYVGKSNPKEKARKINGDIVNENLSNVLPELTLIWFFWVRLESMWHSKVQHERTADNDPIMQEIMTMLSFDGSNQGWAVISKGSDGMAKAKGDTMLESFVDFESWKQSAEVKGFLPALNDHLRELHSPYHCNRLILPGATGSIPEKIVCAECRRPMEKFIMYRCCND
uniref:Sieve element occlusion N-terminal domain-containing protein n=1 Tax=Populus davidiana TaxID=266767 RepID=A0A6M2F1U4_9ROSI